MVVGCGLAAGIFLAKKPGPLEAVVLQKNTEQWFGLQSLLYSRGSERL